MRGHTLAPLLGAILLTGCTAPSALLDDAETTTQNPPNPTPTTPAPVNHAPTAPTLLEPDDGARVRVGVVPMRWLESFDQDGDPLTYTLHARDVASEKTVTVRCAPAQCDLDVTGPKTIEWYVTAYDDEGAATPSPTRSFTAYPNTPPTPPRQLTPRDGAVVTTPATATFTPSTDADGDPITYTLWIRDADEGLDRAPCDAAGCEIPDLNPELGPYAWWIEASDGYDTTPSQERGLRINLPPTPGAFLMTHPQLGLGPNIYDHYPPKWGAYFSAGEDPDGGPVTHELHARDTNGNDIVLCEDRDLEEEQGNNFACAEPRTPMRAGQDYDLILRTTDNEGATTETLQSIRTVPPIVFIHGWQPDYRDGSETWQNAAETFADEGFEVLDFRPLGDDFLLSYNVEHDESIGDIAGSVARAIDRALAAAGYGAAHDVVIIAHSMGGLIGRVLIEAPGHDTVNGGSIPTGWSRRVETLVMAGTPNRGAGASSYICQETACEQMRPRSSFLEFLGYSAPPGETRYYTIGGSEDAVVPAENVRLDGAPHRVFDACHRDDYCRMTKDSDVLSYILRAIIGIE